MKYSLLMMILILSFTWADATQMDFSDANFQLDDIKPMTIGISLSSGHLLKLFSKDLFLFWGFTKTEAHYYSIFTGLAGMIISELIINHRNNGTTRENSLLGIGIYLISVRF